MTKRISGAQVRSPGVAFFPCEHAGWADQWAEMPEAALAARGVPIRRPKDVGDHDVCVAFAGPTAQAVPCWSRLVLVLADDFWSARTLMDDLGIPRAHARRALARITAQIRRAAVVVVSSEPLVEVARTMNPNVVYLPFAAPPESDWPALRLKRGLRIGWVGAPGLREADFAILREPFARLAGEHEALEFVFCGWAPSWAHELPRFVLRDDFGGGEIPTRDFNRKVAALNLTVAVAPLASTKFNNSRCRLKFIEATVGAGCPLVASDYGPYRRVGEAGAPIATVGDAAGWYAALNLYLRDPWLRERRTLAARAWVAREATIDAVIPTWLDVLARAGC